MKIITINVNGIRAAYQKGLFDYIARQNADVVCLQEIRAQTHQLSERFYPKNYHCYYHTALRKGYSGVAVFSKQKPHKIIKKTSWSWFDNEGRYLQIDLGNLSIISIYIPSGSSKQERQDLKMQFLISDFAPFLKNINKDGRQYIICGDFNMVHRSIDIKNFYANQNSSGCLPEERAWMEDLLAKIGFVDAFRVVNQQAGQYTWWSNRGAAWDNNTGWRIDYQIISSELKHKVKNTHIYKKQRFSDHAPLVVEYTI